MKRKLILIIAAAVLLLAAGTAAYFLFFKNSDETGEAVQEYYDYALDDSFVTNVKDSSRLFKATIVLVADEEGLDDFLASNQYIIRDVILFNLRELTEEDIKDDNIQETLRSSIPAAIDEALGIDSIVSVYFSDFVMQ